MLIGLHCVCVSKQMNQNVRKMSRPKNEVEVQKGGESRCIEPRGGRRHEGSRPGVGLPTLCSSTWCLTSSRSGPKGWAPIRLIRSSVTSSQSVSCFSCWCWRSIRTSWSLWADRIWCHGGRQDMMSRRQTGGVEERTMGTGSRLELHHVEVQVLY